MARVTGVKERLHSPRQLLAAIETVASGGSLIDAKVVEALVGRRQGPQRSLLADLTAEERATLVEMARGSSNAAIVGAQSTALTVRDAAARATCGARGCPPVTTAT